MARGMQTPAVNATSHSLPALGLAYLSDMTPYVVLMCCIYKKKAAKAPAPRSAPAAFKLAAPPVEAAIGAVEEAVDDRETLDTR